MAPPFRGRNLNAGAARPRRASEVHDDQGSRQHHHQEDERRETGEDQKERRDYFLGWRDKEKTMPKDPDNQKTLKEPVKKDRR
jgi:hypothetical protein